MHQEQRMVKLWLICALIFALFSAGKNPGENICVLLYLNLNYNVKNNLQVYTLHHYLIKFEFKNSRKIVILAYILQITLYHQKCSIVDQSTTWIFIAQYSNTSWPPIERCIIAQNEECCYSRNIAKSDEKWWESRKIDNILLKMSSLFVTCNIFITCLLLNHLTAKKILQINKRIDQQYTVVCFFWVCSIY